MFTILQISDLHRSPHEPVDNTALLAALLNDLDRQLGETPAIPAADAVVVSGDIIQGAQLGQNGWERSVREQYDVAEDFLDRLTKELLGGDRSKVVIVPGNHDVCWNTAFAAMEPVEENDPAWKNIRGALDQPGSLLRWSWKDRQLFRVTSAERYSQRLRYYWEFVCRFYRGTNVAAQIAPERGYQIFDLDEGRISVVALDSVHGNDCFSYSAGFAPGAVGRCFLDLRQRQVQPKLRLGVWHHSVQGPPRHDDYMDLSEVYELAGHGFQLGLHGHQHVAAAHAYYVHRHKAQEMAVVSAGSLCAGARELPRGVNRQYNLLVIDDDYLSARLHVREMGDGGHFSRKADREFVAGFMEVRWQPPLDSAGRAIDVDKTNDRKAIEQAEAAIAKGNWAAAIGALKVARILPGSHARRLLTEAANRAEDWTFLATLLAEPTSAEEAAFLIHALTQLGDFDAARTAVADSELDPGTAKVLLERVNARAKVRGK